MAKTENMNVNFLLNPRHKLASGEVCIVLNGDRLCSFACDSKGLRPVYSGIDLASAIENGLAVESLQTVIQFSGLSSHELETLVGPKRTLARRKKEGRLNTDESEKTVRIGKITDLAIQTFGNVEKAHAWLKKPNRGLDGRSPISFLRTAEGGSLVEERLHALAHGIVA